MGINLTEINMSLHDYDEYVMDLSNSVTIDYDQIVKDICQNVDERIMFFALAIPISYFLGNWLYNKTVKRGWFDNVKFRIPFFELVWKFPFVEPYFFTVKEFILDLVVPMCRMFQIFAMGFMIYYVYMSGVH